jgi:hypothetical protein
VHSVLFPPLTGLTGLALMVSTTAVRELLTQPVHLQLLHSKLHYQLYLKLG